MKLKIGFDAKRLFGNFTGLGNYSRTLVSSLQKLNPKEEFHLYSPKAKETPETTQFLDPKNFQVHSSSQLMWRERFILKDLKRDDVQLYHGLSHEIPLGIQHTKIKSVVTIHDLIFKVYPNTYKYLDTKIYDFKFRYACENADKIIAISESTKNDIIKFYNIPSEKIEVIYQSCNPLFYNLQSEESVKKVIDEHQLPKDFYLYVGSIIERKNLLNIIKAYELLDYSLKIPLVIIGRGKEYKEKVKKYIQSKGLEKHFIWLENLTDNHQLQAIYQQAKIFLYPSVYEGFGIPVAEALLSKTSVITSNVSSLPEAGGEYTECIDPQNIEEIKASISKIMTDNNHRDLMIEQGYQYAINTFSQEKISKQVMNLYNDLLNEKGENQ